MLVDWLNLIKAIKLMTPTGFHYEVLAQESLGQT